MRLGDYQDRQVFLEKLQNIVNCGRDVERIGDIDQLANEHRELLRYAKQVGFSDKQIAGRVGENDITVRDHRKRAGITPIVKQIDTLAAEFPAVTNYLFMTYVLTVSLAKISLDTQLKTNTQVQRQDPRYRVRRTRYSRDRKWCVPYRILRGVRLQFRGVHSNTSRVG